MWNFGAFARFHKRKRTNSRSYRTFQCYAHFITITRAVLKNKKKFLPRIRQVSTFQYAISQRNLSRSKKIFFKRRNPCDFSKWRYTCRIENIDCVIDIWLIRQIPYTDSTHGLVLSLHTLNESKHRGQNERNRQIRQVAGRFGRWCSTYVENAKLESEEQVLLRYEK